MELSVIDIVSGIAFQQKCEKYFFINVWRKIVFDICFTGLGTALTTTSDKVKTRTHHPSVFP
jgi:hypothetical protein